MLALMFAARPVATVVLAAKTGRSRREQSQDNGRGVSLVFHESLL